MDGCGCDWANGRLLRLAQPGPLQPRQAPRVADHSIVAVCLCLAQSERVPTGVPGPCVSGAQIAILKSQASRIACRWQWPPVPGDDSSPAEIRTPERPLQLGVQVRGNGQLHHYGKLSLSTSSTLNCNDSISISEATTFRLPLLLFYRTTEPSNTYCSKPFCLSTTSREQVSGQLVSKSKRHLASSLRC